MNYTPLFTFLTNKYFYTYFEVKFKVSCFKDFKNIFIFNDSPYLKKNNI